MITGRFVRHWFCASSSVELAKPVETAEMERLFVWHRFVWLASGVLPIDFKSSTRTVDIHGRKGHTTRNQRNGNFTTKFHRLAVRCDTTSHIAFHRISVYNGENRQDNKVIFLFKCPLNALNFTNISRDVV